MCKVGDCQAIRITYARYLLSGLLVCKIAKVIVKNLSSTIYEKLMDKLKEAVKLASSGRLEEAKDAFEEIILETPRNSEVLYNLGMCFTDLNQPEKAVTVLKKSIEYNPNHSNSYVALGYAYSKKGDSESAKAYFYDALKLDPDNSYALRNLGGLYGKNGDAEKSIFYLEKAYRINPQDTSIVYGLGYSYQQVHDYGKADQYYRKVLEMDASCLCLCAPSRHLQHSKSRIDQAGYR